MCTPPRIRIITKHIDITNKRQLMTDDKYRETTRGNKNKKKREESEIHTEHSL